MPIAYILAALLSSGQTAASASAAPLPLHFGGRVRRDDDGALAFGWPGVYFESRFRGTGVEIAVDSDTEFMRLLIDGEEKALLKRPGAARLVLRGLRPGEHVVRLEKQTESQSGGGRFIGFYPLIGSEPLPIGPRPRQIEFIGDSYTVGYGNISPGTTCTEREVHDRTDTQRAFGPLLANRMGADYRIHAYSGFGIVRNYNGSSPGENLPLLYPRLVPGDGTETETSSEWRPQLIVINLGTNDFSTPLNEGETWASQEALRHAYRQNYVAFAQEVMRKQPQAQLILMGSEAFFGEVERVASDLSSPSRKVIPLRFGNLKLTGCHFHPSAGDHEALSKSLEQAIAGLPGLWSRPGKR